MSKEIINRAEEIAANYAREKTAEASAPIKMIIQGLRDVRDEEELNDLLIEANDWIDFLSGDIDELYEQYSFKKMNGPNGLFLAQGIEDMSIHNRYNK